MRLVRSRNDQRRCHARTANPASVTKLTHADCSCGPSLPMPVWSGRLLAALPTQLRLVVTVRLLAPVVRLGCLRASGAAIGGTG